MSRSDRITITYYERSYECYDYRFEELYYEYFTEVKFKVRKKCKSFHYKTEKYWSQNREFNPGIITRRFAIACGIDTSYITKWPMMPKLRKRETHYSDSYAPQLNCCPKAWNKIMHIRPNRRAWERYCNTMYQLCLYNHYYPDDISYPSNKKHIYYY